MPRFEWTLKSLLSESLKLIILSKAELALTESTILYNCYHCLKMQSHLPAGKLMLIWQDFKVVQLNKLAKNCCCSELEAFTVVAVLLKTFEEDLPGSASLSNIFFCVCIELWL